MHRSHRGSIASHESQYDRVYSVSETVAVEGAAVGLPAAHSAVVAASAGSVRGQREVRVSPKALDLLRLLVASRPRALAKKELLERLWPTTYLSETSLAILIREIRDALGDDARNPLYVRTVHRFGYAFCGATSTEPPEIEPGRTPTGLGCWLVWEARQIQLRNGENILGREPEATAWLDAVTVSRRHARIVISRQGATLEDLGSKNGTYLRGARVTGPSRLVDGDEIHVGSAIVRFRMTSAVGSTATHA